MTTPRAARRSPRTARRSPLPFPIWLRAYASFSVGGATAADVGSRADRKYVRCAFLAASERHGGQVWNPLLPVRCVGVDRIADCPLQRQKTHLCSNVLSAPKLVWVGASAGEVSIPFIAGQWSLLVAAAALAVWRACLNPLHCGAVVASGAHACASGGSFFVSIPFIAGQWSLPRKLSSARCAKRLFQSPSLRGSGRFLPFSLPEIPPVVPFQSPSLRGSGRFVLCFSSR